MPNQLTGPQKKDAHTQCERYTVYQRLISLSETDQNIGEDVVIVTVCYCNVFFIKLRMNL